MHNGIYEHGDIFASNDGEYWVDESNEKMAMLGIIPVYMSAGNHGYWIDEKRRPQTINFSLLQTTPNWYIETQIQTPQLKPEELGEETKTTNLS